MSKKTNPTVIGSFVMGALALSIAGVVLLGGSSYFEDNFRCITYYGESISGLDVGAPVEFQGVRIGTVTHVQLDFDPANGGHFYRPVQLQIEQKRINILDADKAATDLQTRFESLVAHQGLRARLAPQSMLTGKLKVELGFYPDQPMVRHQRDDQLWEMPTIPSPLKKVTEEVANLPIAEILHQANLTLVRLADILNPEAAGQTMQKMNQTMERLESLLGKVDSNIDPLLKSLTKSSDHASAMLDPNSPTRDEASRLMSELSETTKSLRRLADYLEEPPESLLRGKQP